MAASSSSSSSSSSSELLAGGAPSHSGVYTCTENGSNKFWEMSRSGSVTTATWGKVGTPGMSKDAQHDSDESAKKFMDKLIKEKVKKGYVLG